MARTRGWAVFDRMNELELPLCLVLNRAGRRGGVARFFALVSRGGDGAFWYAVMAGLALAHTQASLAALFRMLVAAGMCLATYRVLKGGTNRPRPYEVDAQVRLGARPLDRYSFPSGHTMHAVAFTAVAVAHVHVLAWVLVPFTLLVALSRVVLGLHYPSDVAAGAAVGGTLAGLVLLL